jgi:hypothetical protein
MSTSIETSRVGERRALALVPGRRRGTPPHRHHRQTAKRSRMSTRACSRKPSVTICPTSSCCAPTSLLRSLRASRERDRVTPRRGGWGRAPRRLRGPAARDRRLRRGAEHPPGIRHLLPRVRRVPARPIRRGLGRDVHGRRGRCLARPAARAGVGAELDRAARVRCARPRGRGRRRPRGRARALQPRSSTSAQRRCQTASSQRCSHGPRLHTRSGPVALRSSSCSRMRDSDAQSSPASPSPTCRSAPPTRPTAARRDRLAPRRADPARGPCPRIKARAYGQRSAARSGARRA